MRYFGQDIYPFVDFMRLPHLTHKVLAVMSGGNQTIVFIMKKYFENLSHVIINIYYSHNWVCSLNCACTPKELYAEITLSGTSYLKTV